MKHIDLKKSLLILVSFYLAYNGYAWMKQIAGFEIPNYYIRVLVFYSFWLLPVVLVTGLMFGFKKLMDNLGLSKGLIPALLFALIAVAPMLLSSAFLGNVSKDLQPFDLVRATIFAGFAEEVLFRGFLFGLLFRKAGWGFIPASLVTALVFGMGHVYQGNGFVETLGIFFVTAIGAAWFAWLYTEWNYNLWVAVFLHVLMNLSWTLFEVSQTALGGLSANAFRFITIAITVVVTIHRSKRKGWAIHKANLLINRGNQ